MLPCDGYNATAGCPFPPQPAGGLGRRVEPAGSLRWGLRGLGAGVARCFFLRCDELNRACGAARLFNGAVEPAAVGGLKA